MASEPTLKVKLVKCPKCWKVLPLFVELHIYKCGGCGTLLQAKSQQSKKSTETCLREENTSQKNELDNNNKFLPSKMHLPDKNGGSGTRELGSCSFQKFEGVDLSYKDSEDRESALSKCRDYDLKQVSIVNQSSEGKKNGLDNQINCRDIDNLQPGVTSLSSKDIENEPGETKLGDYSPLHLNNEHSEGGSFLSLVKKNMSDYNELRECIKEQQTYSNGVRHVVVDLHNENGNVSNHDIPHNFTSEQMDDFIDEGPNLLMDDRNIQKEQHDYGDCNQDWHKILNEMKSSMRGDNFPKGTSGGTSFLAEMKSEVSLIEEKDFDYRKMITASKENTLGLRVKTYAPDDVFISSDSLSSPTEQLEHSQRSILDCGLDPYESSGYGDYSFKFSGDLGNVSNSSAVRRPHTYSDSVQHYDSTAYQQQHRHSQPLQVIGEVPDFVLSNRSIRPIRQPLKQMKYKSAELQGLARSSTSMYKKPDTSRNSRSGHIYTEPRGHLHPIMRWDRSGTEHYSFEMPLHQENPLAGFENRGPSNLYQQDFEKYYSSPDRLEGILQERKELLRTVSELEDQLNKTMYVKGVPRGGTPIKVVGREIPLYYNDEVTEGLYHDLKCATSPGRCMGVSSMSKGQKFSRIPYSGEVKNSKHSINHASTYRPRDSRFSAPLPSCMLHQKFGLSRSHLGYSPYSSRLSSPQMYFDSKCPPRESNLLSIDLMNENCATKRRIKVQSNPYKHFLPTAGGAPFITCYSCLNLLQLPADLLLFKRKFLRLKCGSCSMLLKFSFLNKMHVVPYLGNINPPLHEVDGNRDVNNEKRMPSTSHSTPRVEMDSFIFER